MSRRVGTGARKKGGNKNKRRKGTFEEVKARGQSKNKYKPNISFWNQPLYFKKEQATNLSRVLIETLPLCAEELAHFTEGSIWVLLLDNALWAGLRMHRKRRETKGPDREDREKKDRGGGRARKERYRKGKGEAKEGKKGR